MQNIQSSRTDDSGIEQEIQQKGLTAARVTPKDIEDNIKSEFYFTAADGAFSKYHPCTSILIQGLQELRANNTLHEWDKARKITDEYVKSSPLNLLTFCVLVLKNGFTVTGESACASPENFDAEIGRKVALENAKQKIWPLLGFLIRENQNART